MIESTGFLRKEEAPYMTVAILNITESFCIALATWQQA
jgi:hypothetical protein